MDAVSYGVVTANRRRIANCKACIAVTKRVSGLVKLLDLLEIKAKLLNKNNILVCSTINIKCDFDKSGVTQVNHWSREQRSKRSDAIHNIKESILVCQTLNVPSHTLLPGL